MSNVIVIDRVRCIETSEVDPDDSWSRASTEEEHDIRGIKLSEGGYGDIDVPFTVESNKSYYLVAVYYNTGDSFGHDENKVCFIDLFSTEEKAKDAVKRIEENNESYNKWTDKKSGALVIKREDDADLKLYTSWQGYFESMNTCEIHVVELM